MLRRCDRAVVFGLVVGLVGAAAARPAFAADQSEAELIRQGLDARKRHADSEAVDLFERAYAIRQSPRSAAQVGLTEVALGRWIAAEAYLTESLNARDDGWIKKNVKTLTETLERVRDELGSLDVLGNPAGAEIVIASEVRGTLPLAAPIRVRAGDVRFQLRAAGFLSETRTVRVKMRELVRESVSLSQLPPLARIPVGRGLAGATAGDAALVHHAPPPDGRSAESKTVPTSPTAPASPTGPTSPTAPASPTAAGRDARIAGIVAGSLGVVAVGAGVAFGLRARAAGIDASNAATHDPGAETLGRRDQRLQWIGYAAGGALLAGGLITYLIGAARGRTGGAEIGLAASPAGGVAWMGGGF